MYEINSIIVGILLATLTLGCGYLVYRLIVADKYIQSLEKVIEDLSKKLFEMHAEKVMNELIDED